MKHNQSFPADDLVKLAREAFEASGLTQQQAATQLGVSQPVLARAVNQPSASLSALRVRIIEAFTDYVVEGPVYRLIKRKD